MVCRHCHASFQASTQRQLTSRCGTSLASRHRSDLVDSRRRTVEKWPLGVFASIDAGLGREARSGPRAGRADDPTARAARARRARRRTRRRFSSGSSGCGIRVTAVFGGFEGESYADIPTVARTVGLVPPETRAARTAEMKEIADFARLLGVRRRGAAPGLRAARRDRSAVSRGARRHARAVRPLPEATARRCTWKPARSRPTRCCSSSATWSATTCSSTSTRPT